MNQQIGFPWSATLILDSRQQRGSFLCLCPSLSVSSVSLSLSLSSVCLSDKLSVVCLSVRRSVGPSVRRSVRRSVALSVFFGARRFCVWRWGTFYYFWFWRWHWSAAGHFATDVKKIMQLETTIQSSVCVSISPEQVQNNTRALICKGSTLEALSLRHQVYGTKFQKVAER